MRKGTLGNIGSYEDYIQESQDIDIYEKSKWLSAVVATIGFMGTIVFLFSSFFFLVNMLSLLGSAVISQITVLQFFQITAPPTSEITNWGTYAGLSLIITVIALRIADAFDNNAINTGVNQEKYRFHLLASGISALYDEDDEKAISMLEEYNSLKEKKIPTSMNRNVNEYLEIISDEENREYMYETYADFASIIIEEIKEDKDRRQKLLDIITNPGDSDYQVSEIPSGSEEKRPASYMGIIKESLSDFNVTGFKPNFWLLYILAAAIGIALFYFVNSTLGILTVTILLTALQIHDRRDRKEEAVE